MDPTTLPDAARKWSEVTLGNLAWLFSGIAVAVPIIVLLFVFWRRSVRRVNVLERKESEKELRKEVADLQTKIVALENENNKLCQYRDDVASYAKDF